MSSQSDPNHPSEMTPDSSSRCEPIRTPEPSDATAIHENSMPDPRPNPDAAIQCLVPSRPASPSQVGPRRGSSNQGWWRRVGYNSLLTLAAGAIAILASCATLIFLWWGADAARDRHEPEFWKIIVSRGWAPRVVTICSAAIRTSMVLHTGLIAAAAAALMLETSGTSLVDIGVLSTERALKSSPMNILPAASRRCLKADPPGLPTVHFLIVVTALFIVGLSSFISTILLSDFTTMRVAAPETTNPIAFTLDDAGLSNSTEYWNFAPSANWRFAETKLGKTLAGWNDTGDTYRALLPIARAELRGSLEHYDGLAVVLNLRTLCGRPKFEGTADLQYLGARTMTEGALSVRSSGGVYLFANASVNLGSSTSSKGDTPISIGCELKTFANDSPSWPLSLCPAEMSVDRFQKLSDSLSGGFHDLNRFTILNSTFALDEMTWESAGTLDLDESGWRIPNSLKNLSTKVEGVWTKFFNQSGTEMFGVTSCFVNTPISMIYNVTMSGRSIPSEPILDGRRMEQIWKQFGVDVGSRDFEKRGILDLNIKDSELFPKNASNSLLTKVNSTRADFLVKVMLSAINQISLSSSGSWALIGDTSSGVHAAHAALFQSIIQKTLDPAQALQALVTRMCQIMYYEWQNYFNIITLVTTVYSTETLIPARWTGLFVVLGLVGLHLVLTAATMALFAHQTKFSTLGETWQAIAQTVSPEIREVIERGDVQRDKDVKEWAKATGLDAGVYHVTRSDESGRIEVQLRAKGRLEQDLQTGVGDFGH